MIRKVKTGWQVDIRPDGTFGRRIRKTFKTQGEAKRFEAVTRAKAAAGEDYRPPRRDKRRLWDLAQLWYDMHGATLRDNRSRLGKLRQLVDLMGNPLAISITPADAARFRQKRLDQGLSPNTINHDISYLRAVFNFAIRMNEWQHDNPFAKLQALRLPEREPSFLSEDQISRLFQELSQSRNKHVVLIASICLTTGARWSEAQTLRAEFLREGRITFVNTKNGRTRTVPIDQDLFQRLKDHGPEVGRVFPQDAYLAFTRALDRSGIELPKGQRTHVLRHTFASHFMMNGGNLLTLQKILGHQSIQMTMRYAHLSPDHLSEAVKFGPTAPGL
ncbi:phage integrase [Halomonas nitroreducens]|uniref:Integrase n=1 Tax=Halomonas nitroreducens TaxID=447425 RepID=A0A3S0JUU3_9GAMM|nr:tyrosine-type recombinase/integrase [Halomonas nitroreducens]RTR00840.1 integrase [Halomonas nitroreducens]